MRLVVLDASALVGLLLDPRRHVALVDLMEAGDTEVAVPGLADVEVLSVMRRLVRGGRVEPGRAADALDVLADLGLRRFSHESLLGRAFALRDDFSAYDAIYVALAEGLGAVLVTADGRLARAVRSLGGPQVELVGG